MTALQQLIYLATTDSEFRRALQADPKAATAARGLNLDDEEWGVLMEVWDLLVHHPVATSRDHRLDEVIPFWFGGPPFTSTALEQVGESSTQ